MITQYTNLTEQEEKKNRQAKILETLATVFSLFLFLSLFVGGLVMFVSLAPSSDTPVLRAFFFLFVFLFALLMFFASIFVAGLVVSPITKKAEKMRTYPNPSRFDKSALLLRERYGWNEPCVVTKCYDSSDRRFQNRDVCLFCVDNELRLTIDLKHGFSIKEVDLGCYAWSLDELSVELIQGENYLITELKSTDVFFHLGRRAKGYIERIAHAQE